MSLLTQEQASTLAQRTIELKGPDGVAYEFTIRRLGSDEMIAAGILPANLFDTAEEIRALKTVAQKAKRALQARDEAKKNLAGEDLPAKVNDALVRGMVRPRAWGGAESERPKGALQVQTLGVFREPLFAAIMALSSATEEAEKAVRFPGRAKAGGRARTARKARR